MNAGPRHFHEPFELVLRTVSWRCLYHNKLIILQSHSSLLTIELYVWMSRSASVHDHIFSYVMCSKISGWIPLNIQDQEAIAAAWHSRYGKPSRQPQQLPNIRCIRWQQRDASELEHHFSQKRGIVRRHTGNNTSYGIAPMWTKLALEGPFRWVGTSGGAVDNLLLYLLGKACFTFPKFCARNPCILTT